MDEDEGHTVKRHKFNPDFSLDTTKKVNFFKNPTHLEHIIEALRKAGIELRHNKLILQRYIIAVALMVGFTFQVVFAETVIFQSTSKGKDGKPIKLTGILTKPEGNGPFPAVILLHGCSGVEDGKVRNEAWSNRLVKWGYVTLQVDSFGPRNISNICTDDFELFAMSLIRTQDAYDAKVFLAGFPFVDLNRIGVLGWSHGGWTSLNVASRQIKPQDSETAFKAAVAFYPYCEMVPNNFNAPLLILIGEWDDWAKAKSCSEMIQSKPTKPEIILKIYPGAYHDFDWEGVDEIYVGHRMLYDPIATQDAIIQVKSFLAKHLK
jgi:dienelactone hydrolase